MNDLDKREVTRLEYEDVTIIIKRDNPHSSDHDTFCIGNRFVTNEELQKEIDTPVFVMPSKEEG